MPLCDREWKYIEIAAAPIIIPWLLQQRRLLLKYNIEESRYNGCCTVFHTQTATSHVRTVRETTNAKSSLLNFKQKCRPWKPFTGCSNECLLCKVHYEVTSQELSVQNQNNNNNNTKQPHRIKGDFLASYHIIVPFCSLMLSECVFCVTFNGSQQVMCSVTWLK